MGWMKTTLQITDLSTSWGLVEIQDKTTHEVLNRYKVTAEEVEQIHRGEILPPNFTVQDHATKYYSASSRICNPSECHVDPVTKMMTINAGIVEDPEDMDVVLLRVSRGYWRKVDGVVELDDRLVGVFQSALSRIVVANP